MNTNFKDCSFGKTCILHLNDDKEPVLSRVLWSNEKQYFHTMRIEPQCPHSYFQGITCVVIEQDAINTDISLLLSQLLIKIKHSYNLFDFTYTPKIACISIGEPCEKTKSLVDIWLNPSVSFSDKQTQTYIDAFSLHTDVQFSPIIVLLSHFIEQLGYGGISIDTEDILTIAKNSKLGYLGVSTSPKGNIMQSSISAASVFRDNSNAKNAIIYHIANTEIDINLVEQATNKIFDIRDFSGHIEFGISFCDHIQAVTYILAT